MLGEKIGIKGVEPNNQLPIIERVMKINDISNKQVI